MEYVKCYENIVHLLSVEYQLLAYHKRFVFVHFNLNMWVSTRALKIIFMRVHKQDILSDTHPLTLDLVCSGFYSSLYYTDWIWCGYLDGRQVIDMWTAKPLHIVDLIFFIFFDHRSDLEAERKKHEKKDQEHKERLY